MSKTILRQPLFRETTIAIRIRNLIGRLFYLDYEQIWNVLRQSTKL